jgi:hypothetical protein
MLGKAEIKGKARRVIGAIKESLGWLTDDHKAEGEGKCLGNSRSGVIRCHPGIDEQAPYV